MSQHDEETLINLCAWLRFFIDVATNVEQLLQQMINNDDATLSVETQLLKRLWLVKKDAEAVLVKYIQQLQRDSILSHARTAVAMAKNINQASR